MPIFGSRLPDEMQDSIVADDEQSGSALSSFSPYEGSKRSRKKSARSKRNADKTNKKPSIKPFERIVGLCSVRDRSRKELEERLIQDGYRPEEVHEAIERAISCNLVDNMRFAESFVRGRVRAGKGEAVIRRDLAKHDIDIEMLQDWPDAFGLGYDEQVARAVELLTNQPPRAKDAYQAGYRKLISRGYPKAVATKAVSLWNDARM